MSLFSYTSPAVAHHQNVTDTFDALNAWLTANVPAGPDREAAVSALVEAAANAHVALDKVPAIADVPNVVNPAPSPVASEGSTVDAGVAQVAEIPPSAPAAPAPPVVTYVPVVDTVTEALASYPPGYPSDVIREEPGQPKPGT